MDFEAVARQLRKPEGDFGRKIAENMNTSNALMNHEVIEKLRVQAGDNILEIGMANGLFVKDILSQSQTVKYTGADFSPTMVEESISRNKEFVQNGRADFLQASAGKLPFANDFFDKVFTINTVYFWENPATELAEIQRIIKPKGKLITGIRPKQSMEKYPFTPFGFKLYSKADITNLLQSHNFIVTETIEKHEPEQQLGDITIQPEFLIVMAEVVK